jgi:hypothetical protein
LRDCCTLLPSSWCHASLSLPSAFQPCPDQPLLIRTGWLDGGLRPSLPYCPQACAHLLLRKVKVLHVSTRYSKRKIGTPYEVITLQYLPGYFTPVPATVLINRVLCMSTQRGTTPSGISGQYSKRYCNSRYLIEVLLRYSVEVLSPVHSRTEYTRFFGRSLAGCSIYDAIFNSAR